ncbi:RING-H2 finger protein ATL1 [Manihot esculenta]|uniref:RING-type domain-containing protein n=1 Tax=Manihot esculenta TaxID=3983 RepID=A0A2C9W4D1_MANES|nr:RING-H2 finger protein ATL1 [Manihot esculenta]OAY53972.1 hypothetical protein MANES_03G038200v8 [Manihot esculenta]
MGDSLKPSLPMLYYGLVIVGIAAVVLAIYNLIFLKCTNRRRREQSAQRPTCFIAATAGGASLNSSTFKFRKDDKVGAQGHGIDYECAVCLSAFEEGEEIRQLLGCNHYFHASCIDMWLFSHSDCPLCRSRVDAASSCRRHVVADTPEDSRENLPGENLHLMPLV